MTNSSIYDFLVIPWLGHLLLDMPSSSCWQDNKLNSFITPTRGRRIQFYFCYVQSCDNQTWQNINRARKTAKNLQGYKDIATRCHDKKNYEVSTKENYVPFFPPRLYKNRAMGYNYKYKWKNYKQNKIITVSLCSLMPLCNLNNVECISNILVKIKVLNYHVYKRFHFLFPLTNLIIVLIMV